jgi:hypothetical protein
MDEGYLCLKCTEKLTEFRYIDWPLKGSVWNRCCKCKLLTHVEWKEFDEIDVNSEKTI